MLPGRDPTPLHVQAYPCLRAQTAITRWRRGRPKFAWHTKDGLLVGFGRVESIAPWLMDISYFLEPLPYLREGGTRRRLLLEYRGTRNVPMFKCVRCSNVHANLVFGNDGFGCADCYVLKPMARVVPANVLAARKIRRIMDVIRNGRPPRMSTRDYIDLHHRLALLIKQAPDWEYITLPELPIVLPPAWMRLDQHPELDL